jgi:ParB-like chromosome segregation protein Spo0J
MGHARALLSLASPAEQLKLREEILAHSWSVRATEEGVQARRASPSPPAPPLPGWPRWKTRSVASPRACASWAASAPADRDRLLVREPRPTRRADHDPAAVGSGHARADRRRAERRRGFLQAARSSSSRA